jgi:oligopeptide/dipeptide ABC transporter ATP-binding protein
MSFLQVNNLSVFFPIYKGLFKRVSGHFKAVDNVSFELNRGEVLSIIGESGSGKTTIGNAILGLLAPTSGNIIFNSSDIKKHLFQGRIQAVFQNPYSSLNPRTNVLSIVGEPLLQLQPKTSRDELIKKVREVLETMGLDPNSINNYPHQFSGGQRQRISIARALISEPELLILDEPVSSLDVSIRAQILNLLSRLKKERNLSYIYISHDLATVRFLSKKIIIIYKGRIMETGGVSDIFNNPKNPYTQLLLKSAIEILVEAEKPIRETSETGCPFYERCPVANGICSKTFPQIKQIKENHYVYCHNS